MHVLKKVIEPTFLRLFRGDKPQFECSICNYVGAFKDKRITKSPDVVRVDSKCPGCGAAERHRMMKLVIDDLFGDGQAEGKSVLHMAPEPCMQEQISSYFDTYHTSDFLMKGMDFNEDIQNMSFADSTYDCVVISRVLTIPPDLDASISELRRILKPGGIAIIAEIHAHEKTVEYGEMRNERSRLVGVDILDHYGRHFERVEQFDAHRYDSRYQLINRMKLNGVTKDDYPEQVREPDQGFQELVAVCYA